MILRLYRGPVIKTASCATNVCRGPEHLGRILPDGGFDIVASRPTMSADPYLTAARPQSGRGKLRVVS